MSKLAKAIDYEVDSAYYYKQQPLKLKYTDVKFELDNETYDINYIKSIKYKLEVKLQANAILREFDPKRDEVIGRIKRAMIEEVFGEFRPMIYNMYSALYDMDTKEAEKILRDMENVMFYEGLTY